MARSKLSLLLLVLLSGCVQDNPVSPFEPQMSKGGGADVQQVTLRFPFNNVVYLDCVGEQLHFSGVQIARAFLVTTPSGLSRQHMYSLDEAVLNDVIGVPSGTVWKHMNGAPLRNKLHFGGQEQSTLHSRESFFLENGLGQRIHLQHHVILAVDENGVPTGPIRYDVGECTLLGGK